MPRLPLVPLLAAIAVALSLPAEALAECGGATRFHKADTCPPTARATATPNQALPGEPIELSGATSSVASPRTIVQYAWDFDGDGTDDHVSSSPTVSHAFAENGRYDVRLIVTDNLGMSDPTAIEVAISTPPVAALSAATTTPMSHTDVELDASASADPGDGDQIVRYAFDLDDDPDFELDNGDAPKTTVQFPRSGSRTIRVQVTDPDGATDVAQLDIEVGNQAPVASLTGPSLVFSGQTATLSAAGSSDLDGDIVRYRWDLDGDDVFETDGGLVPTLERSFPTSGSHEVGVQVEDNGSLVAADTFVVAVKSPPAAALVATPQQVAIGATVTLDASGSSDADGALTSFTWDLDRNNEFERTTGTTATTTVSFASAGTKTVSVRVYDGDDLFASASVQIVVAAPATGGTDGGTGTGTGAGTGSGTGTDTGAGSGQTTSGTTGGTPASGGAAPAAETGGGAATPRAGASGPAPAVLLDSKAIQSLRSVLKSGLRIACRSAATTRCVVRVEIDRATAKRLKLGRTTRLATVTLRGQGTGATSVKLSARARRALARVRSVRLLVKGSATAADGSKTPLSRVVLARR